MVKRATKTTKTRRYRLSKKNPKRPRAILKMDLGNVEQQISLIMPREAKYANVEIPKEKNEDLTVIWFGRNIKICMYAHKKDFESGFVYDSDGIYLERIEKHDLKTLYNKIGVFLKAIKRAKG